MTDAQLIRDFLSDRGVNTTENYARWIRDFTAYSTNLFTVPCSLNEVTYSTLSGYREHLVTQGLKQNSLVVKMRCVLSLLSFAFALGHIDSDPGILYAKKARNMLHREPTVQSKIVSQSTMQMIFDNEPNEYYRLFLKTLYMMGLRVSECIGLDISTVVTNNDQQFAPIPRKGGRVEYVYMPETIYLQLTDITTSKPFPFNRRKAHQIAKDAGARVGVPKFSPHFCRHGFGSHTQENGATPAETMAGLGHKCLSSTSIYSHSSKQAADYLTVG